MKPLHLALGIGTLGGLLLFAFVPVSTLSPQPASTAYAQSTPSVSFTQEEVQGKEGSTIYLRVKLDTPVTKTTKVTIKLTPDQGTTSRDIPGLTGTKTVTFYKNGTQTKTVAIRTSRTAAEGDKSLTASITKVGNTTVQGDTARILVKDQRSSAPLTGNQNNTATTTPPTNCAQYEGVIPGEGRKVSLQYRRWALQKYNYPISAEAQAQLNTMRGDLGNLQSFRMIGGGFGNWSRESFSSGVAYVWPIKTTQYNDRVAIVIAGSENPLTVDGEVIMSISKCPGDFTSPQLLSQRAPSGERLPNCVSTASARNFGFLVTSGNPGGYTCDLEPNSQYYLNISAGFSKPSPLDQNGIPTTYHSGVGIGGYAPGGVYTFPGVQSADMIMYTEDYRGQGYAARPANGAPGLIKGKDEYYRENDRVAGIVAAAMQQRVAACRAAIGTGAGDRGVSGGGECRGIPFPLPAYEWE